MGSKSSGRKKKSNTNAGKKKIREEPFDIATKEPGTPDTDKLDVSKYEEETQDDIQLKQNFGLATEFVNRIYLRVRQIKESNPDFAAEIDMNEWFIKEHMSTIRTVINQLPQDDRELVTILVIVGLHKIIDDILIVDPEKLTDLDAREVDTRTRKLRNPRT